MMFRSNFALALNRLFKDKFFSVINIFGLGIGLAACIAMALYVEHETSYDKHWQNVDRIFRLTTTADRTGGNPVRMGENSPLLLPALRQEFSEEIQFSAQTRDFFSQNVYAGQNRFQLFVVQVESDLIEIFDFDIVAGDLAATLDNPDYLALSVESARRLFGHEDVVGETLELVDSDTRETLYISAVYRLPDANTVLELPALRLLDPDQLPMTWLGFSSRDYIKLKPGVEPEQLRSRMQDFTDRHVDISSLEAGPEVMPRDRFSFDLQNISEVYLHSPFESSLDRGNATVVLVFSLIALLVLVIGCINFALLSTAKATQRAREVAVRKAVGASRFQLFLQFMGESFLLVFLGMLFSLAALELILPWFETLAGIELTVKGTADNYGLLLALLLAAGIGGGIYPALILSGFLPASILKSGRAADSLEFARMRNVLLVFQFGVTMVLMIATVAIYAQVRYMLARDPGFDMDNLLVIEDLFRAGVHERKAVLKSRMEQIPGVESVSLSGHQPMQTRNLSTIVLPVTLDGESRVNASMSVLSVDQDFFRTYRIPLVAGRYYEADRDQASSLFPFSPQGAVTSGSIVINTSAARELGFTAEEQALGRQLTITSWAGEPHTFTIQGVVADTQFYTLRNEPRSEVYALAPFYSEVMTVRFAGPPQEVLIHIDDIWKSLLGDALLITGFVDENMEAVLRQEYVQGHMLTAFSLLAVLIASLGLLGSASFNVERRVREIAIRKSMGAEILDIIHLLLWQFTKPVILANVIAWPIAIWIMMRWLQSFPYHIEPSLLLSFCAAVGLAVLAIAWVTVGTTAAKAASQRPVMALRYE